MTLMRATRVGPAAVPPSYRVPVVGNYHQRAACLYSEGLVWQLDCVATS